MRRSLATVVTIGLALAACGDADDTTPAEAEAVGDAPAPTGAPATDPSVEEPPARAPEPTADRVTLVAYDSFPVPDPDHPIHIALAEFTAETGIEVELLIAGDTGTMLSKAELTAGNPEGDVMWGIDNTFLSRALDAGVFEPYLSPAVADLPDEFTELVPNGEATPVDFGDVCVNYDIAALDELGIDPPSSLGELAERYADLLVVQNPATSSPGLAFLMASIAEFGDDWGDFWATLRDGGVEVVDSWTSAYYEAFSLVGGDRPFVVSYGSSPPFEVLFAAEPTDVAPTGVIEDTCFRQIEFAGVLAGTDAPTAARRLIDFLVSERFQREVPLNLFVFPVNPAVELDPVFTEFATIPDAPRSLEPSLIAENRSDWIDAWTEIMS